MRLTSNPLDSPPPLSNLRLQRPVVLILHKDGGSPVLNRDFIAILQNE